MEVEAGPAYGITRQPHVILHRQPPVLLHGQASQVKSSHNQMEHGYRRSDSPLFVGPNSVYSVSPDRESPPSLQRESLPSLQRESPPSLERESPSPPLEREPLPGQTNTQTIPPFRARFPADGLDLRRPVMTMPRQHAQVIDLTDADEDEEDSNDSSAYATPQPEQPPAQQPPRRQRMPRYSRQIIDLSSEPDEDNTTIQPTAQPNSPEVQFVRERPRALRTSLADRQPTPHHIDLDPDPDMAMYDLTVDLDDEVIHVRTEGARRGINNTGPRGRYSVEGAPANPGRLQDFNIHHRNNQNHRAPQGALDWGLGHVLRGVGGDENIWMDEDDFEGDVHVGRPRAARVGAVPMTMDYETVAFGITDPADDLRRPMRPAYSPPPEVGPGFTRSPQEDDVVVCPNCGDELGVGQTDEKKQVWIVKACGHVYCGDCMINRKSKKKGKAKVTDVLAASLPQPFNACQAKGCGKSVNKNHVMQIYL